MKIVLFEGGALGAEHVLIGDEPMAELEELLGGELEVTPINGHFALVSWMEAEEYQEPIRYDLHRLGRAPEPISGNCAVVRRGPDGLLLDVRAGDVDAANAYVRRVGV